MMLDNGTQDTRLQSQLVIDMKVHSVTRSRVIEMINSRVESSQPGYICVSNVHMCMEVFDNKDFKQIVNNAFLTVPDGKPIYWALKLHGLNASHIRGEDLTHAILDSSSEKDFKIGLIGGADPTKLQAIVNKIAQRYPDAEICFQYSPPFRELTTQELLQLSDDINKSGANILFVGIGCPKQERLMSKLQSSTTCVMLGVGAVFDFILGEKRHAPKWMQKLGLEWLYRLISEPGRLWHRYLYNNPRFVYYFFKSFIFIRDNK